VTLSTLVVFTAFGYALGRHADALSDLSRTDSLTGLRNQRAFDERLEEEVARAGRYGSPLSLLILDIDRLKAINDQSGHEAGNAALRAVGGALRVGARLSDLASRIGGDEFAIIAPSTDASAAHALGERIRALVAGTEKGPLGPVTVSVGVSTLEHEGAAASTLLRAADKALYEAKHQGRNRVVLARPT
jgi:diguanylate cyclase (GGDEF)-like protein